ncbi:MAG: DUF1553 domain-containing protein [Fimbriimonas sp.]
MKPIPFRIHPGWPLAASLGVLAAGLSAQPAAQGAPFPPATPEGIAFFETKVRPVLAENCFSCHGEKMQMASLRLDTLAGVRKGGDAGPIIVPGEPDKSSLLKAVRHLGPVKMPPKGKPLSPAQIADLEAWIKMGAPWPTTTGKAAARKSLWSLQPVRKPAIPKTKTPAPNPIDAFVLARIEAKKSTPAAPADRRTLLRRVTFDLTGLPPTVAEVDAFLADKAPGAYERVVDRLLASPRYGERAARLWLDVARYADTKGYVFEGDRTYHHAYTYREWVIGAFNRDLPYDQFVTQQLAADRLPDVAGDDKRPLAALGFLTLGRRFLNNGPDIIDDRIDVTMRGFQGFTVACARCHDHKFDPIPTQDYYSLYGVFASSDEADIPISDPAIRNPWAKHNGEVAALENESRRAVAAQVKRLREIVKDPANTLSAEVKAVLQNLREESPAEGENFMKLVKAFEPAEHIRIAKLLTDLATLRKNAPPTPEFAPAMVDRPNPGDGVVFKRGNPGLPGEPAPRRFLLALAKPGVERELWREGSGRLQLAKAITDRDNPLTARVFVNRIWQQHFGQGIVRTPSDFGFQGEPPTHPELLDYLAATFMEDGWSVKRLHRRIVTSATYRQSSAISAKGFEADPENRLLNRMNRRRLDLEQMRDALMATAGRLDLTKVGGRSVDLWSRPFTPRRAVYGFVERQNLPGIFRTFDFASPDTTSPRRFLTTVPQQALFFMNAPFSVEQARAVGELADIAKAKDDGQRIRRLYRRLFGRLPDAEEEAAGVAYLARGEVSPPASVWRYGWGGFDAAKRRTASFTPFAHFTGTDYRGGVAFPDPTLGWLTIHPAGGHPGRGDDRALIRRWVAPEAATLAISGSLGHGQEQGNGVRARLVSSRSGLLGEWTAHKKGVKIDIPTVAVQPGDTIDLIVDAMGDESFDGFATTLTLRTRDGRQTWDAAAGFGPPPAEAPSRLALYAQALMMTNEFLFVD